MESPGPGNGTQHVNFGMMPSFASTQFGPKVVKVMEPSDKGSVGVLLGYAHVTT
jgi:hypothetical protein